MKHPKRPWSDQPSEPAEVPASGPLHVVRPDEPLGFRPAASWTLAQWALTLLGILAIHQFFGWLPPYLQEVVRNLKGFPQAWADLFLLWSERFLVFVVVLSAVVQTGWRFSTRYWVTNRGVQVKTLIPERRMDLLPFHSIRSTAFRQGLLGWMMDFGTVEIDLGGPRGPVELRQCPKPEAFLHEIQERSKG